MYQYCILFVMIYVFIWMCTRDTTIPRDVLHRTSLPKETLRKTRKIMSREIPRDDMPVEIQKDMHIIDVKEKECIIDIKETDCIVDSKYYKKVDSESDSEYDFV